MNRSTASPLVHRLWNLPIPEADRARAVREFERAEHVVDRTADLLAVLRRRLAGGRPGPAPVLSTATR